MPCAHAHECLHIAPAPFEFFRESARLLFCKAPQRRPSADLPVIALRGFSTERRNGVCQRFSKRCPFHRNDFRNGEQTVEKRFDVAESFRTTEIKQQDAWLHGQVFAISTKVRAFSNGGCWCSPCPSLRMCPARTGVPRSCVV